MINNVANSDAVRRCARPRSFRAEHVYVLRKVGRRRWWCGHFMNKILTKSHLQLNFKQNSYIETEREQNASLKFIQIIVNFRQKGFVLKCPIEFMSS